MPDKWYWSVNFQKTENTANVISGKTYNFLSESDSLIN